MRALPDAALLRLDALAPDAPWIAVAPTAPTADRLAAALGDALPEVTPTIVVLSIPGWRARLATADPAAAVVLADGPASATLAASRALAAHLGPQLLLGPLGGAAAVAPLPAQARTLAARAHGGLVVVALAGGTLALIRRRRVAARSAPADSRAGRLAVLADPGGRVAAVGPAARARFAGWPALADRDVGPGWQPAWQAPDGPLPHVVVTDDSPAADSARAARPRSVQVCDLADLGDRPVFEPTVDHPIGWQRTPHAGDTDVPAGATPTAALRGVRAVTVTGTAERPAAAAATLVRLAARGVPVRFDEDVPAARRLLTPDLAAAVEHVAACDLDDRGAREQASVALRRAAHAGHSVDTAARAALATTGATPRRAPSVSVLLATRRPQFLGHALAQIAAQRYPDLEVVLVAHSPEVAAAAPALLAASGLTYVLVPVSPQAVLGAALNAGVAAASGRVLTKMDDDDVYGPHHIADSVAALRYSGAVVVGKAAEFCYLAGRDRTVRRTTGYGERYHTYLSGASLTLATADLVACGGWAAQQRAVDRRLCDAVERAGERCYRLHGLEFVVHRHEVDHTWTTEDGYFLRRVEEQWSGLARTAAAIGSDHPVLFPPRGQEGGR